MMDVTSFFSTERLTSKEFFKALYGIVFVAARTSGLVLPCIELYVYREPTKAGSDSAYVAIFDTEVFEEYTQIEVFEEYTQIICDAFRPTYTLDQELALHYSTLPKTQFYGARLDYLGKRHCALHIDSEDIYFQFPSARERLGISAYLASMADTLHFENSENREFLLFLSRSKQSNGQVGSS
jgi:hypothetical protein